MNTRRGLKRIALILSIGVGIFIGTKHSNNIANDKYDMALSTYNDAKSDLDDLKPTIQLIELYLSRLGNEEDLYMLHYASFLQNICGVIKDEFNITIDSYDFQPKYRDQIKDQLIPIIQNKQSDYELGMKNLGDGPSNDEYLGMLIILSVLFSGIFYICCWAALLFGSSIVYGFSRLIVSGLKSE